MLVAPRVSGPESNFPAELQSIGSFSVFLIDNCSMTGFCQIILLSDESIELILLFRSSNIRNIKIQNR